ncbi:MAG: hypothetical protein NT154_05155 [Verrucomicrobia bacterium]|nr:hypothetical protein [Verrucomicrobiota bacterium]
MADTVLDANYPERPYHERNGYLFNDYNNAAERGQPEIDPASTLL